MQDQNITSIIFLLWCTVFLHILLSGSCAPAKALASRKKTTHNLQTVISNLSERKTNHL